MNPFFRFSLLLACSICLTACQQLPEKTTAEPFEVPTAWSRSEQSGEPGTQLLDLVYTDELGVLVEQALAANPDLQQTLITLKISQTDLVIARSDWWPDLQATLSQTRTEDTDHSYQGSIDLTLNVDIWGTTLNQVTATELDVAEQTALYTAAINTLTAQVINAWLATVNQAHAVDIQTQRLASLQQTERYIIQRFRNGLGSAEDLNAARTSRLQAEANLAAQQQTLEQLKRSLLTLTGQSATAHQSLSVAPDYPEVILSLAALPEQTLARRPDVTAAYLATQAADQREKIAFKDLLPDINIKAALDQLADSPTDALLKNPAWSLLGELSAPLFQGNALRANVRKQTFNAAFAWQNYRSTLLAAVQEVEDALGQEAALAAQQTLLEQTLRRAETTLAQYQRNYRAGLVTILDLLNVEQTTFDLKDQLDDVTYSRLRNRIDLGLALGLGNNTGENRS